MPDNYGLFKETYTPTAHLSCFSSKTCYQAKLMYISLREKYLSIQVGDQFQKESKGTLNSKVYIHTPHTYLELSSVYQYFPCIG